MDGPDLIQADIRGKNPMSQVPLLEYTDPATGEAQSLTQSLAIIEFLEEAYPATHRVLPTSITERARARQVKPTIHKRLTHTGLTINPYSSSPLHTDCRDC